MTVERANLVYDPEGVVIDLDLQWSGFGQPEGRGFPTIKENSTLKPAKTFVDGKFKIPTDAEILTEIEFNYPGPPAVKKAGVNLLRKTKRSMGSVF